MSNRAKEGREKTRTSLNQKTQNNNNMKSSPVKFCFSVTSLINLLILLILDIKLCPSAIITAEVF